MAAAGKDLTVDKTWFSTCSETFLDVPAEMKSPSGCQLRPAITEEAEAPQSIRVAGKIRNREIERRGDHRY